MVAPHIKRKRKAQLAAEKAAEEAAAVTKLDAEKKPVVDKKVLTTDGVNKSTRAKSRAEWPGQVTKTKKATSTKKD